MEWPLSERSGNVSGSGIKPPQPSLSHVDDDDHPALSDWQSDMLSAFLWNKTLASLSSSFRPRGEEEVKFTSLQPKF